METDCPDEVRNEDYVEKPQAAGPPFTSGQREVHSSQESTEDETDGELFKIISRTRCIGTLVKYFPRCCVFLMGVLLPLLFLIFLSLFFGIILASLEAESEVDSNDDILARTRIARRGVNAVANVTAAVPRICLYGYVTGMNSTFGDTLIDLVPTEADQLLNDNIDLFGFFNNQTNMTEVYEYLAACGESSRTYAEELYKEGRSAFGGSVDDLSFNWIRCYEGAHSLKVDLDGDLFRSTERDPNKQNQFYRQNWANDYSTLYQQYIREDNATTVAELFLASTRALQYATGGDSCYLNGAGSAWFWFTVLTTIGYGNQAPVTQGGRALVYTAGFVCILAFGGVLATTGSIILALTDHSVRQRKYLAFLTEPVWGCAFWGCLWYSWMGLIAFVTTRWKEIRLSEDMSMKDAYWFSYISTTTVGLGDFFLEPELIVGIDLLYFPLMILIGFTLLSAFLGKLSALIVRLSQGGKRSFVESVLERINEEDETADTQEGKARAAGGK